MKLLSILFVTITCAASGQTLKAKVCSTDILLLDETITTMEQQGNCKSTLDAIFLMEARKIVRRRYPDKVTTKDNETALAQLKERYRKLGCSSQGSGTTATPAGSLTVSAGGGLNFNYKLFEDKNRFSQNRIFKGRVFQGMGYKLFESPIFRRYNTDNNPFEVQKLKFGVLEPEEPSFELNPLTIRGKFGSEVPNGQKLQEVSFDKGQANSLFSQDDQDKIDSIFSERQYADFTKFFRMLQADSTIDQAEFKKLIRQFNKTVRKEQQIDNTRFTTNN